jgi:hypothetical protein
MPYQLQSPSIILSSLAAALAADQITHRATLVAVVAPVDFVAP